MLFIFDEIKMTLSFIVTNSYTESSWYFRSTALNGLQLLIRIQNANTWINVPVLCVTPWNVLSHHDSFQAWWAADVLSFMSQWHNVRLRQQKTIYSSVFNITKLRTIHPHPKYTHRVTSSLILHMHNSHLYTSTCRHRYETWHRPVNIHTSRPYFTQALKLLSDATKSRIRELLDHMVVKNDWKLYRLHNTLSLLSTGRTRD